MKHTLPLFFLLAGAAIGQHAAEFQRVPGPVRNAGIYHLATETWTRSSAGAAALGPDVIYRNDAPNGTLQSGDTLHFQCWFRDGQSSNFSDAASVSFP